MSTPTRTSDQRTDAARTLAIARRGCAPECFAYHATWRLTRHSGLKGHPGWHTGFYRAALTGHQLPTGKPVRALICGAADETMLAVLTGLLGDTIDVHLIDACPTPLAINAAYARRRGLTLTAAQATAPALPAPAAPYDLAVTDGLLSLLPAPADRDRLLATLASQLAPGGLLLYTTRIARSGGVLEYDRLGRALHATTARLAWPGPGAQRRRLAGLAWRRTARPSPYASHAELAAAFARPFGTVRVWHRTRPATFALRLHAAALNGGASHTLGIAASDPRVTPGPR
jgi:hypothetical protein